MRAISKEARSYFQMEGYFKKEKRLKFENEMSHRTRNLQTS